MVEEQAQSNESVAEGNVESETVKEVQAAPAVPVKREGERKTSSRPYTPRSGPGRTQRRPSGGRRTPYNRQFSRRLKKVCQFCKDDSKGIDYKRADRLRRFITERGNIRSRRKVGNCAKHQRQLAVAIKRARHLALLPYTAGHIQGA